MIATRTAPSELGVFSGRKSKQVVVEEVDEDVTMFDSIAEPVQDVAVLALRLATCSLMIHHGFDKVQNVDGFSANVVAKFFGFLPGPPQFWTLSAAATQVVGAILLSVGVFSRPVALSMSTTMIVAVMYVFVLSYFTANGAGKFSVDEQILGGELQFYQNILNNLGGDQDKK